MTRGNVCAQINQPIVTYQIYFSAFLLKIPYISGKNKFDLIDSIFLKIQIQPYGSKELSK